MLLALNWLVLIPKLDELQVKATAVTPGKSASSDSHTGCKTNPPTSQWPSQTPAEASTNSSIAPTCKAWLARAPVDRHLAQGCYTMRACAEHDTWTSYDFDSSALNSRPTAPKVVSYQQSERRWTCQYKYCPTLALSVRHTSDRRLNGNSEDHHFFP
jgi:hypothetical protein